MKITRQNILISTLVILLIIYAVYFYENKNNTLSVNENNISLSTTTNAVKTKTIKNIDKLDGLSGYANSEYDFTLRFPSSINPRNSFSTFHQIGNNWRINASQVNQGKGLVEFPIFSVDQGSTATGKSYPLYFIAELRVGVSPNTKECYSIDPGYTEQTHTNILINGVTWKKFSWSDAGMMQYMQGESYRTIHNNMCYVMEQVKNGSIYRDENMKTGISEKTLNDYYGLAGNIAKTFKFTK